MFVFILIFINILFFILIPYSSYDIFGLNILFFKEDFYWQILSSMFLHADLTHLILNMIVLFQFGLILEKQIKALNFILLYFIGGMATSILSLFYIYFAYIYFNQTINLIGASGAICVLMGYFAFLNKNSTKGLIVALLLMSFVPLLMGINIAWYGHIFGFVCGYIFAKLKNNFKIFKKY
ncbi:rhomboid family intramembrane serine protease [Campylobacter sp. TTU-622]|uniref:rhomboid family intramembrane serine protease n=1 Tax=unclassified Campylobacter TaxID=2593542 RepID=UPI0019041B3B|nr:MULTISPECIES: rhomboid family intramembrane serine protease [unclassified Campylobacter]MBK1971011.1 rhomboid family intramembrane serine protease [Campylobacter sp. TTU_617]MBK1973135.1 rhomboid family intramembrane serine protease [Campylobacter sp. TTU-622]